MKTTTTRTMMMMKQESAGIGGRAIALLAAALLGAPATDRASAQEDPFVQIQASTAAPGGLGGGVPGGGPTADAVTGLQPSPEPPPHVEMSEETYLGVLLQPLEPVVRAQLGLSEGVGMGVQLVEKGSPAERAGLRQHDVLVRLDDQLIVTQEQLRILVGARPAGERATLTILRGAKEEKVEVEFATRQVTRARMPLIGRVFDVDRHVIEQIPAEAAKAIEKARGQLERIWSGGGGRGGAGFGSGFSPLPPPSTPPIAPSAGGFGRGALSAPGADPFGSGTDPFASPTPDRPGAEHGPRGGHRTVIESGESVVTIANGMTVRVRTRNGTGTVTIVDRDGNTVMEQTFESPGDQESGGAGSSGGFEEPASAPQDENTEDVFIESGAE